MNTYSDAQNGSGMFLNVLKEKSRRKTSKDVSEVQSTPASQRKTSFVQATGQAIMRKKSSLIGMFNRKTSADESQSAETLSKEEDTIPPISPLLAVTIPAVNRKVSASPIPSNGKKVQQQTNLPIITPSQQRTSLRAVQSADATMVSLPPASSLSPPKATRPGTSVSRRISSKFSLQQGDESQYLRERSLSVTSVESVYGRHSHVEKYFEMQNPLLDEKSSSRDTRSGSNAALSLSPAEADYQRMKRNSIYASTGSHVDQSKLLERRSIRMGHLSTNNHNSSSNMTREASSIGGIPTTANNGNSSPYQRDAFSNPELDSEHPSPLPPAGKGHYRPSAKSQSSANRKPSVSETSVDSRRLSNASSTFGSPRSNLRAKRANSKLLHDRANYSNSVLVNVADAAEAATVKMRKTELQLFFACLKQGPVPKNGMDRTSFLMERYRPEDLAVPLFRLYGNVPKGWDSFLPMELKIKHRQINPESRPSFQDQSGLEHNLKELMGETSFVANEQLARFQMAHKRQIGANSS